MSNPRGRAFRRMATELFVIVAGVLIALAADAAWQTRKDISRERVLLADLLDEFRGHEERILDDIAQNRRSQAAAVQFSAAARGEIELSSDSVAALLQATWGGARFDPSTGALRSMLDGGELGLIRNTALRRRLAGWPDRAEEVRLTNRSISEIRSNYFPALLEVEAARPLPAGDLALVRLDEFLAGYNYPQLEALLDEIRETASQIEAELAR